MRSLLRFLSYCVLALPLSVLVFSADAYAQGELQQKRVKRQRVLTPAQARALREEELRKKLEEEERAAAEERARGDENKKRLQTEEERRKKEQAERDRANRLYTEPLIKPNPGQRTIGAPANRPGDAPTSYRYNSSIASAAPGAADNPYSAPAPRLPGVKRARLPMEAHQTLLLIKSGGPFPYPAKDGSVFQNRERRLPPQPGGYYREYTVPTPGSPDRGARRLIVGRAGEMYYTDNHYRSFKHIVE